MEFPWRLLDNIGLVKGNCSPILFAWRVARCFLVAPEYIIFPGPHRLIFHTVEQFEAFLERISLINVNYIACINQ